MAPRIRKNFEMKDKYMFEAYKDNSELPQKVRIEASSKCQLDCVQCYMRLDPEGVEKGCGLGNLKFSDFKKFVDENNFESIEISNHGEIFLNPELEKIIKYAYEKGIELYAGNGVNLNYLPDKIAEALVKYKFGSMDVSIDGASQQTYQQYRVHGDFDKVIANVEKINFYKKKYKSDLPVLNWKFIVFGHNEHEIPLAKKMAKKLNMNIQFTPNCAPEYSPLKNEAKVIKQTGLETTDLAPHIMLEEYNKKTSDWFYCAFLWEEPQINWDGKILGCCSLYSDDFGGNAFKDGFLKAMNHPKMIYAKNMLTHKAPPAEGIPCTHCYAFEDLMETGCYMKSPKQIKLEEEALKAKKAAAKKAAAKKKKASTKTKTSKTKKPSK